jgi:hypothetical protein
MRNAIPLTVRMPRNCRVTATAGDPTISPGSRTVLAIEKLALAAAKAAEVLNVLAKSRPSGFVGAGLLGADDGIHSYFIHWWEHKESLAAFRESGAATQVIGPIGRVGDPYELYELIRTSGPIIKPS